eukprot:763081-Hanusia_phi.AAC.2
MMGRIELEKTPYHIHNSEKENKIIQDTDDEKRKVKDIEFPLRLPSLPWDVEDVLIQPKGHTLTPSDQLDRRTRGLHLGFMNCNHVLLKLSCRSSQHRTIVC